MSGSNGNPYSDYTDYHPVNPADTMNDLKRWQPKYFSDGKGGKFAPACLNPTLEFSKTIAIGFCKSIQIHTATAIGSEAIKKRS